jgi:N-acetylmuramoyl-L-alanine amidase
VIYPKDGQFIADVDSTFIFGNTNPKTNLVINGFEIDVHEDGGFLAFLPVSKGEHKFNLVSSYDEYICDTSINILVGVKPEISNSDINFSTIKPSGRTMLMDDDILEFSLMAKSQGKVFCAFEHDTTWTQMYSENPADLNDEHVLFTGYLSIANINDSSRVFFLFEQDVIDINNRTLWQNYNIDSTDYYVVMLPKLPFRVISLIGRPHIIRTAPGKGYKLVNQPAGIRMQYIGETPYWYRVKLANNIYGFVKKTDAILEPENTLLPSGEVSSIVADDSLKTVQISMKIGDQLPFEIHTNGNLMTIDIYGLNSDTDWIKQNGTQEFIKSIYWTQPQNGVYRLHIRWYDEHFWGYRAFYENDDFILILKKKPFKKAFMKGLKIAIDPGHSHDLGAVGPTGLTEKDANLWIAHELRQLLLKNGAKVMMTRMGHEHLGIYDRVDLATKWESDLLISIHNNALPDGVNPFNHNGTSCYYYFDQAKPLAEAIHKHLLNYTKLPDHGLNYGNLALCRVTDCPAVLVECAFMMIPEQEAMLKTDKFQRKCAKAIYKGIRDYLKE